MPRICHLIVFEASSLHSLSVERQHTASRMIWIINGWIGNAHRPTRGVADNRFGNIIPVSEADNARDGEVKVKLAGLTL